MVNVLLCLTVSRHIRGYVVGNINIRWSKAGYQYHFSSIFLQRRKKKTTVARFLSVIIISEKNYIQANDDQRALLLGTGDYAPVFSIKSRF